jgi:hypothetical protein
MVDLGHWAVENGHTLLIQNPGWAVGLGGEAFGGDTRAAVQGCSDPLAGRLMVDPLAASMLNVVRKLAPGEFV